ncbi:phospholipase A2-like [Leptopilina boulardi]|uniref:phospholipase A2-like n=1 Tax=Leptopilina boulardi TaxID=63433 RepID=UPI0021F5515B|nr:phospholipase A2-like [Leptopilina boulardi]
MSLLFNYICFNLFFLSVISLKKIHFYRDSKLQDNKKSAPTIVYPGTKWCGNGNVAENYNDLGKYAETDACCRDHDHCKDIIHAMETKYNLTNMCIYARVHCSCDEKFYDCLEQSEDKIGNKIGILYFNFLNTKCFRKDYPIRRCKRYTRFPRRCVEYELDEDGSMIYQWFDVPPFK